MECNICFGVDFSNFKKFRGSTLRYANELFTYAKCNGCSSIINLDLKSPDYSSYVNGNSVSNKKTDNFVNFLTKNGITKKAKIIDYGCGKGALVKALRNRGFTVDGYEPFNEEYKNTINNGVNYSLVYLTHVFEHILDYSIFFNDLEKFMGKGSLVATIHPSSSRIKELDPSCPFQNFAIHAPFHIGIPSDEQVIKMFSDNGFKLKLHLPYDVQRSGFRDNNRVSSLLAASMGGIKENWLGVSKYKKISALFKSPFAFFDSMFINTKDTLVSTFIFEKM